MKEICLPSAEETLINLTIGDKKLQIDFFDHQQIVEDAFKEMMLAGERSNEVLADCVRATYKNKYGVDMSTGTAMILVTQFDDVQKELKKKFSSLQEIYDSTDSTGSQKPNENSDSSTSQETN